MHQGASHASAPDAGTFVTPRDGLAGRIHCGAWVDIQTEVCGLASREERLISVLPRAVCPRCKDDVKDSCPALILEASKGVPREESVTRAHRRRRDAAGRATPGKAPAAQPPGTGGSAAAAPEGAVRIGKTGSQVRAQPGSGCESVAHKMTVGTVATGTLKGSEQGLHRILPCTSSLPETFLGGGTEVCRAGPTTQNP